MEPPWNVKYDILCSSKNKNSKKMKTLLKPGILSWPDLVILCHLKVLPWGFLVAIALHCIVLHCIASSKETGKELADAMERPSLVWKVMTCLCSSRMSNKARAQAVKQHVTYLAWVFVGRYNFHDDAYDHLWTLFRQMTPHRTHSFHAHCRTAVSSQ